MIFFACLIFFVVLLLIERQWTIGRLEQDIAQLQSIMSLKARVEMDKQKGTIQ